MYVNTPQYLTGSELPYAGTKKQSRRQELKEVEKEKYVDKQMSKQNWREHLIKDRQFLFGKYY